MRHQDCGDGSHDPRVMQYIIKTGEQYEVETSEVETGASYTKDSDEVDYDDEDDYCEE